MFRVLLSLALAFGMSSCSLFQGDEEELEVSNEANNVNNAEMGNNFGNQEMGLSQEEGMSNNVGSFDNQIGGEDGSVADENPLLNNEEGVAAVPDEGGDMVGGEMPAADFSSEGGVVRYTMGETNVYAQPILRQLQCAPLDKVKCY